MQCSCATHKQKRKSGGAAHRPLSVSLMRIPPLVCGKHDHFLRNSTFSFESCRARESHILSFLSLCKSPPQLIQTHAYIIKTGFEQHPFVAAKLLEATGILGDTNHASLIFNNLKQPNVILWNILIKLLSHSSRFQAISYFIAMRRKGFKPDSYTYTSWIVQGKSLMKW
ncbi:hypothetical protein AMTR_s00083p00099540 [Amborella trichopoda]|uniref:Pentatricopeptide repeat-containing protein n=1 Tax=Amborella trichopoda TaxID=13333 RepID=W1NY14_AMBTC|nr:hypothetical protein AMTR_s00083p00099540 [Amborella trichopoda]